MGVVLTFGLSEKLRVEQLWKPFTLYTVLLGLLTVGAMYLFTGSGAVILVAAGVGLLLVVGGGTAGPTSAAGAEHAEDA